MGKGSRFWDQLAQSADMNGECLPGQSLLELLGDNRVLIEHHRGVQEYSRERIGIKMRYGQIAVCGCGLEMIQMTRDQLVIRGQIDRITLHRRG